MSKNKKKCFKLPKLFSQNIAFVIIKSFSIRFVTSYQTKKKKDFLSRTKILFICLEITNDIASSKSASHSEGTLRGEKKVTIPSGAFTISFLAVKEYVATAAF